MKREIDKIDLGRVASVQASLPACSACGGQYGKHCCWYRERHVKEWQQAWMHSWRCLKCGKETGEFPIERWESMVEFEENEKMLMPDDLYLDLMEEIDAKYFL